MRPPREGTKTPLDLRPIRSALLINKTGSVEIAADDISPENVGLKAYGLASMPVEWVPPYLVIGASCFDGALSDPEVQRLIHDGLNHINLTRTDQVIVRSSGSSETMRNRGRLLSKPCQLNEITATARDLISNLPSGMKGPVHWIVQQLIPIRQLGHLSNERRLRKENRDWVVEIEPFKGRPGYTTSIAIRRWRDGMAVVDQDLRCTSELEISRTLKLVAMWAMNFNKRLHFEWVWNGNTVKMVQAEVAEFSSGIDPSTTIPADLPGLNVARLKSFRLATEGDYENYGKLRNAKMYTDIGYAKTDFYVLEDPKEIASILSGKLSRNVKSDLTELTKRDLILRTDGGDIPKEKREMLPRSDELRSLESAANWLLNDFTLKIKQADLTRGQLCLLAHHFIPSVASAWARAEPGNRIVRIESLWGIPEGLYWYSHDTFEVDTMVVNVSAKTHEKPKYKSRKRLRYKGSFIAPDNKGIWIPHQTKQPFDWKSSIRRREWLNEIAHTTRIVAEREGFPISLMWFLDNHPDATAHKVLPWFHDQSDLTGPIKAAPRKKFRSTRDSVITSTADWNQLKEDLDNGKRIERLIVEPADAELIRNRKFAEELGTLAAINKFVVELAGGILSHVFYILRRQGAQVECKDLYGDEEDIVEYDKLVRDKIPSLIEGRGEHVSTIKLEGQALVTALLEKLVEEAFEAKDSRDIEELVGEIADIEEVIWALGKALEVSQDEIRLAQEQKQQKRGGFDSGTMLIRTATPHSIQKLPEESDPPPLILNFQSANEVVISDPAALPSKPAYRRPDLRQVAQQVEKLFTFETDLNRVGNRRFEGPLKQTLNFSIPIGNEALNVTLSVELVRSGSSLRGVIRLRPGALQLPISFPPVGTQLRIEFPDE